MNVVGKQKLVSLDTVAPNHWNPNEFSEDLLESLRYGLQHTGWLASQAMLIWGTDEKGEKKNIIIDGEHRWKVAQDLGFEKGPAVFLDGLTEERAKAMTVELDRKRGKFNDDKLAVLVKSIQFSPDFEDADLGKMLGFGDEELMKLLAEPLPTLPPDATTNPEGRTAPAAGEEGGSSEPPDAPMSNVKMVQLFLDDVGHGQFMAQIKALAAQYGTKNTTDTVLRAVQQAFENRDT